MKLIDKSFTDKIKIGDRLFHYPKTLNGKTPEKKIPVTAYTLYSVVDLPNKSDVVLMNIFDQKESKKKIAKSKLVSDESWWHD